MKPGVLLWTAVLLPACLASARPLPSPTPGQPRLTVMTYNVNFGLAGDPVTLDAIRKGDADVVFLQETNEAWEHAIREGLDARYPHMAFRHCCRAGGLAVLSRYPIVEGRVVPSPSGWFPSWRVIVRTPLGPVQTLNVHLHPAVSDAGSWLSGAYTTPRLRLAEIARHARGIDRSLPTLVVGDFNEGAAGHSVAYLEARGLTTALPELASSGTTWRYPTRLGTLRLQLDHVFYSGQLRLLRVRVLRAGRSDHLPVVAVFERSPSSTRWRSSAGASGSS